MDKSKVNWAPNIYGTKELFIDHLEVSRGINNFATDDQAVIILTQWLIVTSQMN